MLGLQQIRNVFQYCVFGLSDGATSVRGEVTDFSVLGNCFLREPVGVPNPAGDDRRESDRQKGHLAEETGRSDHKPLFLSVVLVHACCTLPFYTARH